VSIIIGAGGPADVLSIPLVTRRRRRIDNMQRSQRAPEAMQAALDLWIEKHPRWRNRARASTYNCLGLVFANRRTCVDPDQFDKIQADDGYRVISTGEAMPGDVAAYYDDEDQLAHVGMVVNVQRSALLVKGIDLTILSQFGADGEFLHSLDDVPLPDPSYPDLDGALMLASTGWSTSSDHTDSRLSSTWHRRSRSLLACVTRTRVS
jgi:hypothetical protein